MKAYSVNPEIKEVKEIDIEIQVDTAYSFFNSLLIDENQTIDKHVLYSDANALENKKKAFFIGAQLFLGKVLIVGREGLEDTQAIIPQNELEALVSYEVPQFYSDVLDLISSENVNLYRVFSVDKKGEKIELNIEWVLYTFNIADEKTQDYFLNELKKVLESKDSVAQYMQKMAQLAVNAI